MAKVGTKRVACGVPIGTPATGVPVGRWADFCTAQGGAKKAHLPSTCALPVEITVLTDCGNSGRGPPIVSTSEYPKGKIGRFRGPGDLIGALQRRGHGSEKTLEVGSALPGQHIPPCWGPVPSRFKIQDRAC